MAIAPVAVTCIVPFIVIVIIIFGNVFCQVVQPHVFPSCRALQLKSIVGGPEQAHLKLASHRPTLYFSSVVLSAGFSFDAETHARANLFFCAYRKVHAKVIALGKGHQ